MENMALKISEPPIILSFERERLQWNNRHVKVNILKGDGSSRQIRNSRASFWIFVCFLSSLCKPKTSNFTS